VTKLSFSLSNELGLFPSNGEVAGGTKIGGGVRGVDETDETERNELPDEMDGVEDEDEEIDGNGGGTFRFRC